MDLTALLTGSVSSACAVNGKKLVTDIRPALRYGAGYLIVIDLAVVARLRVAVITAVSVRNDTAVTSEVTFSST